MIPSSSTCVVLRDGRELPEDLGHLRLGRHDGLQLVQSSEALLARGAGEELLRIGDLGLRVRHLAAQIRRLRPLGPDERHPAEQEDDHRSHADEDQCDPPADSLGHQCPPLVCKVAVAVNRTEPVDCRLVVWSETLESHGSSASRSRISATRTCDGATPEIVNVVAGATGAVGVEVAVVVVEDVSTCRSVGATGADRHRSDRRGRLQRRQLHAARQDAGEVTQRRVPDHPLRHDRIDDRHPGRDLGLGVLDDLSARLDGGELRLLRSERVLLAADDRTLVDVEAREEQHDDRRCAAADPEHAVGRQPGADGRPAAGRPVFGREKVDGFH